MASRVTPNPIPRMYIVLVRTQPELTMYNVRLPLVGIGTLYIAGMEVGVARDAVTPCVTSDWSVVKQSR